ncbi:CPCC family cysteine-rich protein [Clostridium ganghwense]|nr:CPCC family cysteine-rich protein [Clostridium ganghwense]
MGDDEMKKAKKYIPTASYTHYGETKPVEIKPVETENIYEKEACSCCGYLTIPVDTDGNKFDGFICPVCFWEIDTFINSENEESDSNGGLTLVQARLNYRTFGACDKRMLQYVRKPTDDEK